MKKNNCKLCLINKCATFITYAKPGSRLGLSFVNMTPNPFSKPSSIANRSTVLPCNVVDVEHYMCFK